MKNKKGFTLIELLAVIIILGILMIIAVPSVTKYISDSRKNGYVSTAKSIVSGVRNLVNSGTYDMYDNNITYYVDGSCVKTENGYKSPYGDFVKTYVAVTATYDKNNYYWVSVDNTGTGVKNLINIEDLESDNIESNILENDIVNNVGIDGRNKIVIIGGENCTKSAPIEATKTYNSTTKRVKVICPQVTETIYWALQNPDSNNHYTKLVISDSEVTGGISGSFSGETGYASQSEVPWYTSDSYISTIEIDGVVAPVSTSYWFYGTGNKASSYNVDISNLSTCHVTKSNAMFSNAGNKASSWSIIGLDELDTSNITNMSMMFSSAASKASNINLNLSGWDTSKVTNMTHMFFEFGYNSSQITLNLSNWHAAYDLGNMFNSIGYLSSTFNLKLNNWDTSQTTNISNLFYRAGYNASSWSIDGLSNWDTSEVQIMNNVFNSAGYNASHINLDLKNWNISNSANIGMMFSNFGHNSESFNLDLRNWNTSTVTYMNGLFDNAGLNATNFNIIIPQTNGNGINNTTDTIYGSSINNKYTLSNGKLFTITN